MELIISKLYEIALSEDGVIVRLRDGIYTEVPEASKLLLEYSAKLGEFVKENDELTAEELKAIMKFENDIIYNLCIYSDKANWISELVYKVFHEFTKALPNINFED